jgi:hypothetical protein
MIKKAAVTAVLAPAVIAVSGCGKSDQTVRAPFTAEGGVAAGPTSGLWGDGSSGPTGMEVGCIRDRRLVVLITVRNRSKRTITLLGGGGAESLPEVVERDAVQIRLAPPPPMGDAVGDSGIRSWSAQNSAPVSIPAGRSAWIQSNFLMRACGLLRADHRVTLNRSITLRYSSGGQRGTQEISVTGARIILTRGPLHPKLPINKIG